MKSISIALVLLATILSTDLYAGEFIDKYVWRETEPAVFIAGENQNVGTLVYIVDRNTGICLAGFKLLKRGSGSGGGVTVVDCEKLKKIPTIKKYLETGK